MAQADEKRDKLRNCNLRLRRRGQISRRIFNYNASSKSNRKLHGNRSIRKSASYYEQPQRSRPAQRFHAVRRVTLTRLNLPNRQLKIRHRRHLRQKFPGYQRDEETNLDFAEARYYNNSYGG